jgi:hypothetical protein
MPLMRMACWVSVAALSAFTSASAQTASDSGVVVGIVTATGTNARLPFADITVESARRGTFADSLGRFRITGLPLGVTQIRARRLGFAPSTRTVTVTSTAADTIHIALTPVSLELHAVRTNAARVCNGSSRNADTVVVAILDQVRANAERSQLLAREYPYEAAIERTMGDRIGRRETTQRIDTITRLGGDEREWKYEPGALIQPANDAKYGAAERMMIPELADFADGVFIGAHCFQFAGLERVGDQQLIRLTFEPSKSLRGPDVSGSIYLSPDTYQLRRSTLRLERVSPSAKGYLQIIEVESVFLEVVPFVPVLDAVSSTTTARSFTMARAPRVPFERQRLIDFRFLSNAPTITKPGIRPTTP